MSKQDCFLGIDTSNYTTSAAVCDGAGQVIANLKVPLPVRDGACGLRQADAVFAHVKNLPVLMERLGEVLGETWQVRAVGVSVTPRDAEGSYMPCFLTGKAVAAAMSAVLGVPLYPFSHQNGHIRAALYSSGAQQVLMGAPFCAFHVSGGTTEALYVEPGDAGFSVTLAGETGDINAGQAIDRVGVMLGLSFPCGPALEALAAENDKKVPGFRVSVQNCVCHLSGLENLAEKWYRETGDKALVADAVLQFIGRTLCLMTEQLLEKYPGVPVLYAGGVMSNRYLQSLLAARFGAYFAQPAFSADNAAGISLLCREAWEKRESHE